MGFKERLTKEWLFWDGGTGSVLQSWGLQAGELPETWNIIHPEKIVFPFSSFADAAALQVLLSDMIVGAAV